MAEHTEQTPTQPGAVPARVELDDFIEAVSRGVTRALAAQDEVSGYAAAQYPRFPPGVLIGIYYPGNPGGGPTFPWDPNPPILERK